MILFVDVLSTGPLIAQGTGEEGLVTELLWQEVRHHLRTSRAVVNEWIEVDTSRFRLWDFDHRKEMVRAGEVAGQRAAQVLINNYGF